MEEDPRVSTRMLSEWLDIPKSTVHISILTQGLSLRCVTSVWVPHELSDQNKTTRVNCAKNIRKVFHRDGLDNIFNKLAVQDEFCIYFKGRSQKARNKC